MYNYKNVDLNLFHSSPTNVVSKKIKIASNVMVTCCMIDQLENKGNLTYDYAALTFQRKTAGDKMYQFRLPLTLTPNLIQACKVIMEENKTCFQPTDFVKAKTA